MVAGGNRCPNSEDVELFNPKNPTLFHCWHLLGCPDGHGRSVKPGSVHPSGTDVDCKLCPKGMFSSHKTNNTCIKCAKCGYNKELSNCTHSQDRQCLRECVSKMYYLNATDGQCYQCSECCGSDPSNVQPHCLASFPFSIGTTVIGQKGATHCGVRASQKCEYSFDNPGRECGYNNTLSNSTSSQDRQCLSECVSKKCYLNTTNGQCYQCSECCGSDTSNIQPHCLASSPFSIGTTVIGQKGAAHCGIKASQKCGYSFANRVGESSFNKVIMIAVAVILGFFFCVSVCVNVWCYIKGRRSSGPSFQSGILCCLSSSLSRSLG